MDPFMQREHDFAEFNEEHAPTCNEGDARCNFCNGPMPCFCNKPEGWRDPTNTEIKRDQK